MSVYAVSDGKILSAQGDLITIQHEDGLVSLYAGCALQYKKAGQSVKAGEMIGALDVNSPVLEFGLKKAGKYVDPLEYMELQGW